MKIAAWIVGAVLLNAVLQSFAVDDFEYQAVVDGAVTTFFEHLDKGGLDEVQYVVQKAYQDYDTHPNSIAAENVVTIDIAAHVFIENLPEYIRKNLAKESLEYWSTTNTINRINKKLYIFIKDDDEREKGMLAWLQTTHDAMYRYYQEHNQKHKDNFP